MTRPNSCWTAGHALGLMLCIVCSCKLVDGGAAKVYGFTSFAQEFNVACPNGQGFRGLRSIHENEYDRKWRFLCEDVGYGPNDNVAKFGTLEDRKENYDHPQTVVCPRHHYLAGALSKFHGHYSDRLWIWTCRQATDAVLSNCQRGDYVNNWDEQFKFIASDNRVITGVNSYHDNNKEDRRFRFTTCRVDCSPFYEQHDTGCVPTELKPSPSPSYDEHFQQTFFVTCHNNQGLVRVRSDYDEGQGDRKWRFQCAPVGSTQVADLTEMSTAGVEDLHGAVNMICPTNYYLRAIQSGFVQAMKDRLFKFQCQRITGAILTNCQRREFVNPVHGALDVDVERHQVIAGLASMYSAVDEDRRWHVTTCDVSCANGFTSDGARGCIEAPCGKLVLQDGILSGNCQGRVGDECQYSGCNLGYRLLSPPVTRVCQADGSWTNTAPVCKRIESCGPQVLPNGHVIGACDGGIGDACTFSGCEDGFKLSETGVTRVCQADGTWSNSPPHCERVPCKPLTLQHGQLVGDCGGDFGDTCVYRECNDGYSMLVPVGPDDPVKSEGTEFKHATSPVSRTCMGNGTWSNGTPICHRTPTTWFHHIPSIFWDTMQILWKDITLVVEGTCHAMDKLQCWLQNVDTRIVWAVGSTCVLMLLGLYWFDAPLPAANEAAQNSGTARALTT
ncbi:hypothetical protein PTSG_01519 [Salpingoeca rosetta]|uniref:Sushi domain-containing protein n=1 Tax=Salpingoeca rosetta (strain ATCC 50818 / BSB-021) TaxID=946362 RepID=F2U0K8_SALR5|nr:uncharacterized protein PTSG_01519 [Salpingoeca rosetta]EGD80936.1 hypothetical protein PTSG_01519 [Salpingoeca rosetta]|eukprot:XP_004997497.1 hypothetical protein PTSG_01519 [Salpingoeca rosetta]